MTSLELLFVCPLIAGKIASVKNAVMNIRRVEKLFLNAI